MPPDPVRAADALERLSAERAAAIKDRKELSDALLTSRPLGGSECFTRRGSGDSGAYIADAAYFRRCIADDRARYHAAMKDKIMSDRRATAAESALADTIERCAQLAQNGCFVRSYGDPTDAEQSLCYGIAAAIRSLLPAQKEKE